MKKIFPIIIFLLLLDIHLSAQEKIATWGDRIDLSTTGYAMGIQDDHYYVLSESRKENSILKFSLDHKLVSTKKFNFSLDFQKFEEKNFITTKENKFFIHNHFDKDEKIWSLNRSEFIDGKFSKFKEIYKYNFNYDKGSKRFGITHYGAISSNGKYVYNEDESRMVYSNHTSLRKKGQEQLLIALFDDKMNLLWEKLASIKYSDVNVSIVNTICTKDDEVYALCVMSEKKKAVLNDGRITYNYRVFRFAKDEEVLEIPIDFNGELEPKEVGIFYPENGDHKFIITGFYKNDDKKRTGLQGSFFAAGSDTGITMVKKHKFEKEFIAELEEKFLLKRDDGLNLTFKVKDYYSLPDGSVGFIGEEAYLEKTYTTSSTGRSYPSYVYHSNDLILIRYNSEGDLISHQKIMKTFKSADPARTSYAAFDVDDKMYLVFNVFRDRKGDVDLGRQSKQIVETELLILNKGNDKIEHHQSIFDVKYPGSFEPAMTKYFNDTILVGGRWRVNSGRGAKGVNFGFIDLK